MHDSQASRFSEPESGLSQAELHAEAGTLLPNKEVLSLLDVVLDLDLFLDLAAPIDLAVAANANLAAPISAAASANILSDLSTATSVDVSSFVSPGSTLTALGSSWVIAMSPSPIMWSAKAAWPPSSPRMNS